MAKTRETFCIARKKVAKCELCRPTIHVRKFGTRSTDVRHIPGDGRQ